MHDQPSFDMPQQREDPPKENPNESYTVKILSNSEVSFQVRKLPILPFSFRLNRRDKMPAPGLSAPPLPYSIKSSVRHREMRSVAERTLFFNHFFHFQLSVFSVFISTSRLYHKGAVFICNLEQHPATT